MLPRGASFTLPAVQGGSEREPEATDRGRVTTMSSTATPLDSLTGFAGASPGPPLIPGGTKESQGTGSNRAWKKRSASGS